MKTFLVIALFFISPLVWGQLKITPTDSFTISGKVRTEITVKLTDLSRFESRPMGDVPIFSNLGAVKGTARDLKGVLLKDILNKVDFQAENQKALSEFYITCIASDGYKVVFSWNEIFNTDTGDTVYIITEKEELKIAEMPERILLISTKDFKTGRRYVKGLQKIVIERAN
jgi:hypothetical protein